MKFLFVFFDMVRPNLLNLFDPAIAENDFSRKLKLLGGTLYTKCYTPGPDTPRSMSCFWSGQPTWINGCDTRLKYPRYYMISPSFLDLLKERNYQFNFFLMPGRIDLGILPKGYEETGNHNDKENINLEKFLSDIDISDNSFTFIDLPNFHWTMDDYIWTKYGADEGFRINADCFDIIDRTLDFNSFDYIVIFSDHGCKMSEQSPIEPKYHMMNADRTQILMQLKTKGEAELKCNDKLCSIMDVFPTICDILHTPYDDHGYSLLSPSCHDYIISEDSGSTDTNIYQSISLWVLINKYGMYFRCMDGSYFFDSESAFSTSPEQLDKLIEKKSIHFREFLEYRNMHTKLQNLKKIDPIYTNGESRKLHSMRKAYLKRKVYLYSIFHSVLRRIKKGFLFL